MNRTVRPARPADFDDVAAFTADTWRDRGRDDYIPDVFERWAASTDRGDRTLVVDVDGTVVGLCNALVLSDWEGWLQGIRVDPEYRGEGHARALTEALFDWCRECGASVARSLVYGWNEAGLGQSRGLGFVPTAMCRWIGIEPVDDTLPAAVRTDPDAAWSYWTASDARANLAGLTFDADESWAMSTLTREGLATLSDRQAVLSVGDGGTRGMTVRVRTDPISTDGDETVAVYGVAAWTDQDAVRTLFDAVRADAASAGADRARICVPETARYLADASAAGGRPNEDAMVVTTADLTGR